MRILHTSDWHLGISLGRRRLTNLQTEMLDSLVNLIDKNNVEVVVVAGDIYDQSVPPLDAIELFDNTVGRICLERHIPLVAIAGNHDSPERLTQYSSLLGQAGLFISGRIDEQRVVQIGSTILHLFPYFHTAEVRRLYPDESISGTEDAMKVLVQKSLERYKNVPLKECLNLRGFAVYHPYFQDTELKTAKPLPATSFRHIAVAHCFIQNCKPSGTDRMATASMGGSTRISASVFESYDHVFLGHLHRRQQPLSNVSYSGSPAIYAFSEIGQQKGVYIYDTDSGLSTFHNLILSRALVEKTGTYDALCKEAELKTPMERMADRNLLRLVLSDKGATVERREHLRTLYPNLVALESTYKYKAQHVTVKAAFDEETLKQRPIDVLEAFYRDVVEEPLPEILRNRFESAWEQSEGGE